jgi:hypothetical protein
MAGRSKNTVAVANATGLAIADPVADPGAAGAAISTTAVSAIADPGAAGADITATAIAGRAAAVRLNR